MKFTRVIAALVAIVLLAACEATQYEYQSCYKPGETIPAQSPYFNCVVACCVSNCDATTREERVYEDKPGETFLAENDKKAEECWGSIVGDPDQSCPKQEHYCSYGGTYDTQALVVVEDEIGGLR